MKSVNKVMLLGHLGHIPELREVGSGTQLATASLATNRSVKTRDDRWEETAEWHRLAFWGRMAQAAVDRLSKGDAVWIEGRLEYRQTDDDGVTRTWASVVVEDLVPLGRRKMPEREEGSNNPGSGSSW